jgi:hypothetical protein
VVSTALTHYQHFSEKFIQRSLIHVQKVVLDLVDS